MYFQPQGKYIIYNRDTAGNEAFQLYLYDTETKKTTQLSEEKSRNVEPVWSNAGEQIIYGSTPQNGNGVNLYVMNPHDPKTKRLLVKSNGHMLQAIDWSPDDQKVVFVEYISNNSESILWMVDVSTGEKTSLTPSTQTSSYSHSPQFSKDGKGVYVSTNYGAEFQRIAYIDLATKEYKYLTDNIRWDVDELRIAPDRRTLAFVINEDGVSRLNLLDTKSNEMKSISTLPAGVISSIKWHNNSADLAFNLESARSPNDVYSVNTQSTRVELWSKSVTNGVDVEKFAEPALIHWKSFDDKKISGILYRPPAKFTGKRPVIVDIHGGPDEQFRPRFLYEANCFVNELGVALIYPNVRGSAGYGRSFIRLDDGMRRVDAIKDYGALLEWIKTQPDLDPDRVMVQGFSYGGYAALSVAMEYNDRIRAALSDCGPSNLATYLESTEGWRRDIKRAEYGDERDPKMRQFLEKTAPANNVYKIKKPLMIVQGANDPRVKASQSSEIVQALKNTGTPVWYVLAKNEGHGFVQPSNREYQLLTTIMFIERVLLK